MHNLKELKIWHKSIDLAVDVYKATEDFPREETYGITAQSRKAAVSVVSNIAEGAGRNSDREFVHFLGISNGSLYELQSQLIISFRLKLISGNLLDALLAVINELQKMIYGLQERLNSK